MSFDQKPDVSITEGEALELVRAFVSDRAEAGLQMAKAFTQIDLSNGILTASWSAQAVGDVKSETLLSLNPFDNLAIWLGTPLAFDNEEGRQIREHVHTVSVIGPFGVGTMTTEEVYRRATEFE